MGRWPAPMGRTARAFQRSDGGSLKQVVSRLASRVVTAFGPSATAAACAPPPRARARGARGRATSVPRWAPLRCAGCHRVARAAADTAALLSPSLPPPSPSPVFAVAYAAAAPPPPSAPAFPAAAVHSPPHPNRHPNRLVLSLCVAPGFRSPRTPQTSLALAAAAATAIAIATAARAGPRCPPSTASLHNWRGTAPRRGAWAAASGACRG